jgi:Domain of unknown function (DUF4382)
MLNWDPGISVARPVCSRMVKYPFRGRNPRTMYAFPVWRRAPFVVILIAVIVIAYAPATTQGTTTLRLASLSAPSAVTHIYVQVSSVEMHPAGLPNSTGWTTITQPFPIIDLLSPVNQSLSQTISSVTIHSGRYDSVRVFFTNSTLVISGMRTPVGAPPAIDVNSTLLVSPNGTSDLLLVVAFDYAAFFTSSPSLTFVLIRTSTV